MINKTILQDLFTIPSAHHKSTWQLGIWSTSNTALSEMIPFLKLRKWTLKRKPEYSRIGFSKWLKCGSQPCWQWTHSSVQGLDLMEFHFWNGIKSKKHTGPEIAEEVKAQFLEGKTSLGTPPQAGGTAGARAVRNLLEEYKGLEFKITGIPGKPKDWYFPLSFFLFFYFLVLSTFNHSLRS